MDEITLKIAEIMKKHVDVENVSGDTLLSTLDIDSLDLVEAMMDIEEEFNVEFTNDEIMNLKCFNDIVNLVKTKK